MTAEHRHPANIVRHDERSRGQRAADSLTGFLGSWRFIGVQTVIVAGWVAANVVAAVGRFDPYPFILLNLAFSLQAAYTGPLVLLSSNRSAEHDRHRAEHAYRVGEDTLAKLEALAAEHAELRREVAALKPKPRTPAPKAAPRARAKA